jgi:hypothetical protein
MKADKEHGARITLESIRDSIANALRGDEPVSGPLITMLVPRDWLLQWATLQGSAQDAAEALLDFVQEDLNLRSTKAEISAGDGNLVLRASKGGYHGTCS